MPSAKHSEGQGQSPSLGAGRQRGKKTPGHQGLCSELTVGASWAPGSRSSSAEWELPWLVAKNAWFTARGGWERKLCAEGQLHAAPGSQATGQKAARALPRPPRSREGQVAAPLPGCLKTAHVLPTLAQGFRRAAPRCGASLNAGSSPPAEESSRGAQTQGTGDEGTLRGRLLKPAGGHQRGQGGGESGRSLP